MNEPNPVLSQILSQMRWSAAGDQEVARPSEDFWAFRKSHRAELEASGLRLRRSESGAWAVYRPVSAASAPVAPASDRQWSAEQQAIFEEFRAGRRNLVVRARAGTGKTTTISHAFSVAPEASILYAVFNKRNQREAVEKISDPRVDIRTLHALGYAFVKNVWSGARPDDAVESDRCEAALPDASGEARQGVRRLVGFAKNQFCGMPTLDQLLELADDRDIEFGELQPMEGALAAVACLEAALEKDSAGRISFDDMVWLPVAKGWVRPWFDLVVVDEAQDMNVPQLRMAAGACRPGGRVIVVGDDRQAIYGFRGAAANGLDMMRTELQAGELGLTTTYRCPQAVVRMAAQIVPDYQAAPSAPEGTVDWMSESGLLQSIEAGQAILSRANAPLMPLCLSLLRAGRRARIEGRDIGRMLSGIARKLNGKSVPHFLQKLEAWRIRGIRRAEQSRSAEQRIAAIEDQAATLVAVTEGVSGVPEIMSRLENLFADSENGAPVNCIVLSSVHKAKGLEWDRVVLLEATFCKRRAGGDQHEEANIRYVALTRARRHLTLVGNQGGA